MFRKLTLATIWITFLSFGSPTIVQAVLLTGSPAGNYALPGSTVAGKPELAGVVIEDLLTPFSINALGGTLSGVIQNRVVRSSVDNTLDFYWRILPDSGFGDITAFRLSGFEGTTLDADWAADGLGQVAPDAVRYFGDGSGMVNFFFDGQRPGGNLTGYRTSYFFYLDTAALNYDRSGTFDLLCPLGGCVSETYSTFAPSPVPIPAAVWLFGTALLGLVGFGKGRKTT